MIFSFENKVCKTPIFCHTVVIRLRKINFKSSKIMKIEINETITELEKGIAEIKGILKANSVKLSKNEVNLSASEKENLWLALEVMEDELNEELEDAGVELNSWDW
jgi:hypothetical protein